VPAVRLILYRHWDLAELKCISSRNPAGLAGGEAHEFRRLVTFATWVRLIPWGLPCRYIMRPHFPFPWDHFKQLVACSVVYEVRPGASY
jgi:hypothetical protein